jgi:DNA-binding LytR/AlgR family response regulator
MMVKLLELWMTPESREEVEKILEYYHPLDRAAMAYALVVYVLTGTKMAFKSAMATQHFKTISKMLKEDMPQLTFANHMKYMVRKYGKKVNR